MKNIADILNESLINEDFYHVKANWIPSYVQAWVKNQENAEDMSYLLNRIMEGLKLGLDQRIKDPDKYDEKGTKILDEFLKKYK